MAYAGTWYALVYGDTIRTPDAYTLSAMSSEINVSSLTPDHYARNADATLTDRRGGIRQPHRSQPGCVGRHGLSGQRD